MVCRQLGYPDAFVAIYYRRYGYEIGLYWLDNVECLGTETDIFTCAHLVIENSLCYFHTIPAAECLGINTTE